MDNDEPVQLIFADVDYSEEYPHDVHSEMIALIEHHFPDVESGLQGDSWIWITDDEEKVAVDSFTSMKHQVKACISGPLLRKVICTLRSKYVVQVLETPVEPWP